MRFQNAVPRLSLVFTANGTVEPYLPYFCIKYNIDVLIKKGGLFKRKTPILSRVEKMRFYGSYGSEDRKTGFKTFWCTYNMWAIN